MTHQPEQDLRLDPNETDIAPALVRAGHGIVFRRMGRNIGWLLGGRGFSAVVSILYLAIAARALGPVAFGLFALILAYGSAVANIAEFRSWQAVIRFGAVHIADERPDRLARLLGFTATLDWTAALAGAGIAMIGVHLVGPLLGWTPLQQTRAALFGAALLLSTGATATGIVRLFDRFDLLTYAETVGPAVRLIGAVIAWGSGAGVDGFLVVWATAALAESAAAWLAAILIGQARLQFGRAAYAAALGENPRLWPFMLQTNLASSLSLLWQQLGTLAVGGYGGPAAAGAFRIASKLAGALAKPAEAMTRVLYPELAKLVASDDRATLAKVMARTTWAAAALAVAMVAVTWAAGPLLLRVFSGRGYEFAQRYLLLLTIAAAIDLCGIVLEPVLNAYGRAGQVLWARLVGALAYVAALAALLPAIGTSGAACAAIAGAIVIRGMLAIATRRLMWRP